MVLNVKIDLDNHYKINEVSDDLSIFKFSSCLQNNTLIPLAITISHKSHLLMPNVYNLAFGPMNINNELDDSIKLQHQDHSRVFLQ